MAAAIRQAKNSWFQQKACQIEREVEKGLAGKGALKAIREIRSGRAGLQPTRSKIIRKENGQLCTNKEETLQRWRDHFHSVLNLQSRFNMSVIQSTEQHQVRKELGETPSKDELLDAVDSISGNKAGGKNIILPEMVKYLDDNMFVYVLHLFKQFGWNKMYIRNGKMLF